MKNEPDPLTLSAERGTRLIALDRLDDLAAPAAKLAAKPGDLDALHDFRVALRRLRSWFRAFEPELDGSVRGKDRRRLRELVRATNRGRDADVQLEWLEKESRRGNRGRTHAIERLIDHLRAERRGAGDPLNGDHLTAFADEQARLTRRLSTVEEPVRMPDPLPPTLGAAIAGRLSAHADALGQTLNEVRTPEDEPEAHAARIAAKRLRYLIEPAEHVRGAKFLLAQLKTLQDDLGALHDAHVLGHRVRVALDEFGGPDQQGIRDVAEKLRLERVALFNRVARHWTQGDPGFATFTRKLASFAEHLRRFSRVAGEPDSR